MSNPENLVAASFAQNSILQPVGREFIVPETTAKSVPARISKELVAASQTHQAVVTSATTKYVVRTAATKEIVSGLTIDPVATLGTKNPIIAVPAKDFCGDVEGMPNFEPIISGRAAEHDMSNPISVKTGDHSAILENSEVGANGSERNVVISKCAAHQ
jgi:hypothetical protein